MPKDMTVQTIVTVTLPWLTRVTETHEILLKCREEVAQEYLWKAVARAHSAHILLAASNYGYVKAEVRYSLNV